MVVSRAQGVVGVHPRTSGFRSKNRALDFAISFRRTQKRAHLHPLRLVGSVDLNLCRSHAGLRNHMNLALMSLKSLLFRVEGSLLDIDLLQILYVFLHPESLLPHVVAVQVVKGNFLLQLVLVQSIRC